jgi:class 3 adenylate cyclase/Tfp pilus assembly protein PilF
VRILQNISFEYLDTDPDKGLLWAQRELALAKKIGWRKGEGLGYNMIGQQHQMKGDYPEALEAFFTALKINEQVGTKLGVCYSLNMIGAVYDDTKQYGKALKYYTRSLDIATEIGRKNRMQAAFGNRGSLYKKLGRYKEALADLERSRALAEELGDMVNVEIAISNIGGVYHAMGRDAMAVAYYHRAMLLAREIDDKLGVGLNMGNMAESHVAIAKSTTPTPPDSLVPPGREANLSLAVRYLKEAINICQETKYKEGILNLAQTLSDAYALQGDSAGALRAYKLFTSMKDSLYTLANNKQMGILETKRALELKDKDIEIGKLKVAAKRTERYVFISGIVLLLVIMTIMFRSYKLLSEEKKRSDGLLLNILPSEVANELKEKGGAEARQYDEVSVLFTDFVQFTNVSERLTPQQLVKELHEYFTAFDSIIAKSGMEKIKTIGDAYLAVSGLPVADPRHAQKAVTAAIAIRDFVEERRKKGGPFEIRVGINSGAVVAGIVGVKKFAYDIWGDTVNTAARMEQHGAPGRINISQATYELVKDEFLCTRRGRIAAKNKGEVDMYFVETLVSVPREETIA